MSTAAVSPEGIVFPRKVAFTDVDRYPEDYIKAKARVGEKFLTLKDGRQICYFTDGEKEGNTPVIFLHGGGEGKYSWLQKTPMEGIYAIAIDRMGYGGSDLSEPVNKYTFVHAYTDVIEIADQLGLDKFVICGFSIGSSWALQIAVQDERSANPRVRGLALFGCMADTGHPKMSKAQVSKVGRPPGCLNPVNGCCGCILRGAFGSFVKTNAQYKFETCFKEESSKPTCRVGWELFKNDPFWVCSKVDSFQAYNRPEALMGDAYRSLFSPWMFDIAEIKMPVFIHQGAGDYDMGSTAPHAPNFVKEVIAHAQVTLVEGYGHVCITGPTDLFRSQLRSAVEAMV
mmetsp:Transcript_10605/g.25886  ORF Transcript_10605/g.25886 Transcript_10605/m.25886 type:complete len:342 (+) Transcript_10605:93-1118(+)|eukprot:CAMPEP_0178983352 /NCGR_PEP_ID=MMETSP0795-20121207/1012_1 /TAXON_ID=88552 /ORGANISM="Amoebophrya sp., Strain Ameob2" /LENGTH=341 /DNA_ID=CAMNT_0020674115 /DNA_START=42 /DNA_END=1067 /DNA_ORIENTATION=-